MSEPFLLASFVFVFFGGRQHVLFYGRVFVVFACLVGVGGSSLVVRGGGRGSAWCEGTATATSSSTTDPRFFSVLFCMFGFIVQDPIELVPDSIQVHSA